MATKEKNKLGGLIYFWSVLFHKDLPEHYFKTQLLTKTHAVSV